MADRKQGARLSSGSSAAVHKANCPGAPDGQSGPGYTWCLFTVLH